MPSKLKEKLAISKEKLKARAEKLKAKAKQLKPKEVISKLRDEDARRYARRCSWLILGLILYLCGKSILDIVIIYLALAIFLFFAAPFVFKYCSFLHKNMVFLPYVKWPGFVDFEDPFRSCGLENTRNLYLEINQFIRVGVWHILPSSYQAVVETHLEFEKNLLEDEKTVFLYLHGNSANRAGAHRVELYKVLRQLDCHVICCDYRGYADSTPVVPDETGVVEDAKKVYEWIVNLCGGDTTRIIVWGHSLGTGISGHLVSLLCQEGNSPAGLVLESPFNNIYDEVRNHPMTWVWSKMPWFDWFFTKSLKDSDIGFETDHNISVIDCPVLILHAEDDAVVPFKLGKALYETAQQSRGEGFREVQFKGYSADLGYAHKYICRDPSLPQLIREFIERCSRDCD